MSLDVYLTITKPVDIFDANVTHNLVPMANECHLYHVLWCPEEHGYETARSLIGPLREGLAELLADPEKFKKLNPSNGWGDYEGFVQFIRDYLAACEDNPDASVRVSR